MPAMGITVSPLSPAFGVEVQGVNLDRGLDADEAATLLRLFDEHNLLIFRDQDLSADNQVDVCRALRPVVEPHAWVSNVEPGFHPEGELLCHSDFAFTPSPMLGLSLYAIEIADGAAPTKFASNLRAARRLPDGLRARVEGPDRLGEWPRQCAYSSLRRRRRRSARGSLSPICPPCDLDSSRNRSRVAVRARAAGEPLRRMVL